MTEENEKNCMASHNVKCDFEYGVSALFKNEKQKGCFYKIIK